MSQALPGIQTSDPAFGLPALWVPIVQRTLAEISGYTVVDPTSVLVTHLSELVRRHAPELLTRQDVQVLVDAVKQHSPAVVEELVPGQLTMGQVQKVLQLLLKERVPIRDLATILEALSDGAAVTRELPAPRGVPLTEGLTCPKVGGRRGPRHSPICRPNRYLVGGEGRGPGVPRGAPGPAELESHAVPD